MKKQPCRSWQRNLPKLLMKFWEGENMAIYKNKVEWRGEHRGYTWCQNGTEMEFSAPPDLYGLPNVLTPEDAYMAAANTCYHMMVIWAMERFKIDLVSFECE